MKPAKPTTYVRTALRLLRTRSVVSAQQVAYHAHRKVAHASAYDLYADQALACSSAFQRANFVGSNHLGITLWKLAEAGKDEPVRPTLLPAEACCG